jgi:hypothetical protein
MVDWDNVQVWDKLYRAQELLEKARMDKLESTKNAMVTKWILAGDRCFQKFFEFHKVHRPFIMIEELLDGGRIINR